MGINPYDSKCIKVNIDQNVCEISVGKEEGTTDMIAVKLVPKSRDMPKWL